MTDEQVHRILLDHLSDLKQTTSALRDDISNVIVKATKIEIETNHIVWALARHEEQDEHRFGEVKEDLRQMVGRMTKVETGKHAKVPSDEEIRARTAVWQKLTILLGTLTALLTGVATWLATQGVP